VSHVHSKYLLDDPWKLECINFCFFSSDDPAVFQADAVRNLFEFMVRVQATQHDILKNSDKSVEYQVKHVFQISFA